MSTSVLFLLGILFAGAALGFLASVAIRRSRQRHSRRSVEIPWFRSRLDLRVDRELRRRAILAAELLGEPDSEPLIYSAVRDMVTRRRRMQGRW